MLVGVESVGDVLVALGHPGQVAIRIGNGAVEGVAPHQAVDKDHVVRPALVAHGFQPPAHDCGPHIPVVLVLVGKDFVFRNGRAAKGLACVHLLVGLVVEFEEGAAIPERAA